MMISICSPIRFAFSYMLLGVIIANHGAISEAQGLSPRYYLGTTPDIIKRASGLCAADEHSCLDVNATACCSNDKFCLISTDLTPACCPLGSSCGVPCAVSEYVCQTTLTINKTVTASPTCCPRSCSTSSFKCAATLGGGCCPYGYGCGNGQCTSTVQPTTSAPAVVGVAPSGCTTGQVSCASSVGGGCCGTASVCTVVDNTNYCAAEGASALRTGPGGTLVSGLTQPGSHSGLSSGAKAGIGGGIGGLALFITGAVIYFCVSQRRRAKARRDRDGLAMSQSSAPRSKFGGSKTAETVMTRSSKPGLRQMSDYSGPDAKAGPYTDRSPTTPGFPSYGGVPLNPHGPGDIAVPVEIDSIQASHAGTPGYDHKKDGTRTVITELP